MFVFEIAFICVTKKQAISICYPKLNFHVLAKVPYITKLEIIRFYSNNRKRNLRKLLHYWHVFLNGRWMNFCNRTERNRTEFVALDYKKIHQIKPHGEHANNMRTMSKL